MSIALLDVNVLLALFWPPHSLHEVAFRWFEEHERNGWATCSLTQVGFVRMLSNPLFIREAPKPVEAIDALRRSTEGNPSHHFWKDTVPITNVSDELRKRIQGHRQFVDAYLLTLTLNNSGIFVTFDSGMSSLVSRGSAEEKILHILRP